MQQCLPRRKREAFFHSAGSFTDCLIFCRTKVKNNSASCYSNPSKAFTASRIGPQVQVAGMHKLKFIAGLGFYP